MVREVRNSLGSTNLPDPISKPQAQRDIARPVDTAITGTSKDSTFNSFIQGLSSINPALQRFAQNRMDEQNHQEVEQGKRDAILGQEQQSDAELYAHGYMKIKGTNAAAEDMAELQGYLEQNYNPDSDDFQGTVKGWLKNKTSPSTDKAFLEGYAPIMDRAINQLSNHYTTVRVNKLKADVESTAMKNLSLGMGAYIENGEPIPDEFILGKKQEFANHFKMSEAKFEELQFLAAKGHGDKGNYTIYEQFKKNKPDGTPGMYFNPAWKEKIDAAEYHAQVQYIQMTKAAEQANKKDRENRQEKALQSVFVGALTGEYGDAVGQFKKIISEQPNLFLASEISEWTNKLSGLSKMSQLEETQEQRVNATYMMADIYSGKASIKSVMDAALAGRISYPQAQQLQTDVFTFQSKQRELAAMQQKEENSIYKTPEFKSQEDYISTVLTRDTGPFDGVDENIKVFKRQQKASAILEFTQRAREVSPSELPKLAHELVTRYSQNLDLGAQGTGTTANTRPGLLRFQSGKELGHALDSGKISPEEFEFQFTLLKQKRESTKANATK